MSRLGTALETALEHQHALYAAEGRAFVQRLPVPTRHVGEAPPGCPVGSFLAVRTVRSTTDYVGVLGAGRLAGRGVFIEVKSCAEDRCAFYEDGNTRGGLRRHQADVLARVQRLGGLGLAIVLLPSGVWVVDVETWGFVARVAGRKSWSRALFSEHAVMVADGATAARVANGTGGRLDWLAALQKAGIA